MAWTVEYNKHLRIIEVVLQGNVTGPEIRAAATRANELHKQMNVLDAVIDATDVQIPPPIIDIYELPAKQFIAEGLNRRVRMALVNPRSLVAREAAHFYETACINMGWQVKSFPTQDKAVAWLTNAEPGSGSLDTGQGL